MVKSINERSRASAAGSGGLMSDLLNTPEGGLDEAIRVGKTYFRELRQECDTLRTKLDRIKAIAETQLTDDPPISDLVALTRILTEIKGE